MLNRIVESLLINIFNRQRRRWEEKGRESPAPHPAIPPNHIVIGRGLPAPQPDQEKGKKTGAVAPAVESPSSARDAVALSPEAWRRHLYVLGATGTGKTNFLLHLIDADIAHRRAFCVVDLRGDLVDRVLLRLAEAAPAQEWRERLLLIDLRREDPVVAFNPLLGEGDVFNRAMHLLSVLKQQSDSWGVQLEETLRNCLIALAQTGWSILEIETLLENAAFRQEVLQQVTDINVLHFFERFEALSPASRSSWTLAVLNKVTPLLSIPRLRLMFSQRHSFPLRRLLDQQPGMVILVSLAVDQLHQVAYLAGGLFISSLQTAIMARADQPEAERVPIHLYVDEFETMATERFESIVAEGRRFGLGLCLSHQNLSQLSPNLRHVLRNNVHTQVYFQTGSLDATELAREVSSGEASEVVRNNLMTQGVGEAYLVRRGQSSIRMRTLPAMDPVTAGQAVEDIRNTSLSTYARSRAVIERELNEREEYLRSIHPRPTQKGSTGGSPPVYEIRHDKVTRFRPQVDVPQNEPEQAEPEKEENADKKRKNKKQKTDDAVTPTKPKVTVDRAVKQTRKPAVDSPAVGPSAVGPSKEVGDSAKKKGRPKSARPPKND